MTNATMLFDEQNVNAAARYLAESMPQSKAAGTDLNQEIMDEAINRFREAYSDNRSTQIEINEEGKLVYLGIWKGLYCSFVVSGDGNSPVKKAFTLDRDPEGWNMAMCAFYIYAA